MNPDVSRRSACDRCRGQKLRCVRSLPGEGHPDSAERPLAPCDRCRKAGAECVNTLYLRRRQNGGEAFPTEPAQERAQISILPKFTIGHPSNGASFATLPGNSTNRRLPESGAGERYGGVAQHALDNPSKRRALDAAYNQVGYDFISMKDGDLQSGFSHNTRGEEMGSSSGSSNSLLVGYLDSDSLMLDINPPARPSTSLGTGTIDFGTDAASRRHASQQLSLDALMPLEAGSRAAGSDAAYVHMLVLPPMKSMQDCQDCLSELCSRLVKIANDCGTNCKTLNDILSYNPHASSTQPSKLPKNAIGLVLETSQVFLDILNTLRDFLLAQTSAPGSPANSVCSYSELWDPNEFIAITDGNAPASMHDDLITFSSRSSGSTHNSTPNPSKIPAKCLDLVTTLTAFTCYTSLLHTYSLIFSCIHSCLDGGIHPSAMPSIIPDVIVGGFNLDDHRDLQVEIFLQLSAKMFERIEDVLGIEVVSVTAREQRGEGGILDASSVGALLEVIAREDGTDKRLAKRVLQTVAGIHRLLGRRRGGGDRGGGSA